MTIVEVPLIHRLAQGSTYGDERTMSGAQWLVRLLSNRRLGSVHLTGTVGQEEGLIVLLAAAGTGPP